MVKKKVSVKNKNAVALGKLGGLAGRGSPARAAAAKKAATIRWFNAKRLAKAMPSAE